MMAPATLTGALSTRRACSPLAPGTGFDIHAPSLSCGRPGEQFGRSPRPSYKKNRGAERTTTTGTRTSSRAEPQLARRRRLDSVDSIGDGFGYIFPNATATIQAILAAPINDTAVRVPTSDIAGVNVWILNEIATLGNFTVEYYVFRLNPDAWASRDKIRQVWHHRLASSVEYFFLSRAQPTLPQAIQSPDPLNETPQAELIFSHGFDCLWSGALLEPDKLAYMRFMQVSQTYGAWAVAGAAAVARCCQPPSRSWWRCTSLQAPVPALAFACGWYIQGSQSSLKGRLCRRHQSGCASSSGQTCER